MPIKFILSAVIIETQSRTFYLHFKRCSQTNANVRLRKAFRIENLTIDISIKIHFRLQSSCSPFALQISARQLVRAQSSSTQSPKDKWDLYAGVLVERLPVVTKTLNPLERQFQDMLSQIEYENSLKSDFELKHERDMLQAELIKQGKAQVDLDDSVAKQTAQDLKDAYTEELKKFQFAPCTTPDDAANKTTSTDRCLEDTLYLVVKQKLGQQEHLVLPQGLRQEGESMRQTAERVLRERCGTDMQVLFYGNAPVGFHKYKYPSKQRIESVGAKIFFYRASLRAGNVDEKQTPPVPYEWLPKDVLNAKLNTAYVESINKFLI